MRILAGNVENRLNLVFLERTSLRYNPWKYCSHFATKCPQGSEMYFPATAFPVNRVARLNFQNTKKRMTAL